MTLSTSTARNTARIRTPLSARPMSQSQDALRIGWLTAQNPWFWLKKKARWCLKMPERMWKKAQAPPAGTMVFYIIFAIVFPIVFFMFLFTINSSAKADTKIPDALEGIVLKTSYFFDKGCFAYEEDGISRAYVL